jgi:hypothetical protein
MAIVEQVTPSGPRRIRPNGTAGRVDRNGLEILDEATCRTLLARVTVARVAYTTDGGTVHVAPLNIAVHDDALLFHVSTGGLLNAIIARQPLTIEAGHGWSVIATGYAQELTRIPGRAMPVVRSWLRSDSARLMRLTSTTLCGRRLKPASSSDRSG